MAHQPLEEIKEAFEKLVAQNGSSSELAIFTRNDSEGRLHCEVTVYFSPATIEIAKLFQAEICNKPTRDNLDFLAGVETSWDALFPK